MPDASDITRQRLANAVVVENRFSTKKAKLTGDNETITALVKSNALIRGLNFVSLNKRSTQASTRALLKRVSGPQGYPTT